MARNRRSDARGERTEEERERAREERERRRRAKTGAEQLPPLPPPLAEPLTTEERAPNGHFTSDPPPREPPPNQDDLDEVDPRPSTPDQPEPVGDMPVDEMPIEDMPIDDMPVEEMPIEDMPVEDMPVEDMPVEDMPVEDMPIDEMPVGEMPIEDMPVEDMPIDDMPVGEMPVDEMPVEEMPVEDSPVKNAPVERAPVEDVPVKRVPIEQPRRYPLPLPLPAPASGSRTKGRATSAMPNRSRLHRPHLPRPHIPRWRGRAARVGALLALAVVLAALAVGAVLLVRHSERPKIPPLPAIVKVVIPEGYTRTQIAVLAHADGLRGSYLVASKRSAELRPSRYGAPASTSSLEGFLFPATYEMYASTPAPRLVSEQLAAFRKNFGGAEVHRAKVFGITPYQLLIVASIVEREAAIRHDRALVAAVIYNRLRQNMTLGIDATLRYALHDFTHPLTQTELSSNSPYNTRINKGLPPTPISNPGVAAITAAARPAKVSYLYYVAGSDGCGEQMFSTSYTQFEKDAAAYREALSKNGGRVPTCKKK